MLVKWVCKECNSNNLHKNAILLRCSVCGKIRTEEPIQRVTLTEHKSKTITDFYPPDTSVDSPFSMWQIFSYFSYKLSKANKIMISVSVPAGIMIISLLLAHGIYKYPTVFVDNIRQYITIGLRQRSLRLFSSLTILMESNLCYGKAIIQYVTVSLRQRSIQLLSTLSVSVNLLIKRRSFSHSNFEFSFFRQTMLNLHNMRGAFVYYHNFIFNCKLLFSYNYSHEKNVFVSLSLFLKLLKPERMRLRYFKEFWNHVEAIILHL